MSSEILDAIVVGSGPSGVTAANACVERGWRTLVLDEGALPPPESLALAESLRDSEPTEAARTILYPGLTKSTPFKKAVFGSLFPYAKDAHFTRWSGDLERSVAKGGFSNVWGAVMLPYSRRQVARWKIPLDEWEAAQAEALRLIRVYNADPVWNDAHVPIGRDPAARAGTLPLSPLFKWFLSHATRRVRRDDHIQVGLAAIAGNLDGTCTACGLCMTGCPQFVFFNSAPVIDRLIRKGLAYKPGVKVTSLERRAGQYAVKVKGSDAEYVGKRVFLAAGAIGTAEILMNSGLVPSQVVIRDSHYFLLLLAKPGKALRHGNSISAVQAFVELYGRTPEDDTHLQLYDAGGPMFDHIVESRIRALPLGGFVKKAFEGRLLVVQGYLHSQRSGRLVLSRRDDGRFELVGERRGGTVARLTRLLLRLLGRALTLGVVPLPIIDVGNAGRGQHAGATFPMTETPGPGQTGMDGHLAGYENLYLVDSSSLPEIPPQPITLSVMTNACRIVKHAT